MFIHCPTCQQQTTWQDNPYRPFCSERCKLIDLGAWANDEYRIASEDTPTTTFQNTEDEPSF